MKWDVCDDEGMEAFLSPLFDREWKKQAWLEAKFIFVLDMGIN
jgi:hypothetical protein